MSSKRNHAGDGGITVILSKKRLPKFHLRIETLGALDEASAALGLARSLAKDKNAVDLILEAQKQLYILMAEIASPEADNLSLPALLPSHLEWIDTAIVELEKQVVPPTQFILPGDSVGSAALAVARTIVRRAERRVAELVHRKKVKNEIILAWLNRLSSLIFLLEIFTARKAGMEPTLVRKENDLPEK